MITVKTEFIPSPITGMRDGKAPPPKTFTLDLSTHAPISRILESDEILHWTKLATHLDFTRAKQKPGARHYEPVLRHNRHRYVVLIWKGFAKEPTPGTRYPKEGTDPIASEKVSIRIEHTSGDRGVPTRTGG